MDPGERTTGTRDEYYGLISVLYHTLHGAETLEEYILDAEAAGDERLADFFREARTAQRQLAERAKGLLGIGSTVPEVGGVSPGAASSGVDLPQATGVRKEGETPPVTAAPGEDVTPPEEATPPDAPSPPNEVRPAR